MPDHWTLKIVPAYRGMTAYVMAARAEPTAPLDVLWARDVVEPYWREWAAGQFNESRIREGISRPIRDLDGLALEAELLQRAGVEDLVREAYRRIAAELSPFVRETAVCIMAADPADLWLREHMDGVVGSGVGDNTLLTINPTAANWRPWVSYVLAHEHHHAVWGYNHFVLKQRGRPDLLTSLVIDGLADSFARLLHPQLEPIWTRALTPEQEAEQWRIMQGYLGAEPDDALYRRFMFGDEAAGTPRHTGYTIGYHIVQAYLRRHPGACMAGLLDVDARELLTEGGYGAACA